MTKFLLIIILAVSFTSCSADDESQSNNSDLVGNWNWTLTSGGIAAQINETPESTEKNLQLQLNVDYSYRILIDGEQTSEGKYTLSMKRSIVSGEMGKYITCSSNQETTPVVIISGIITSEGNHLHIDDNYHDGVGSHYVLAN